MGGPVKVRGEARYQIEWYESKEEAEAVASTPGHSRERGFDGVLEVEPNYFLYGYAVTSA